jgi:prevent-host-death family protein
MSWNVAEAKQRLSELLRRAATEPQVISNRGRVVAAVVGEPEVQSFLDWHARRHRSTAADFVRDATRICAEDRFSFDLPARRNRTNPLAGKERRARRHKRPV